MADFTKLSELVGNEFTVIKAGGYQFKMWDQASKRMLVSDTYEQGYRKVYSVDTDKGKLDLGSGQLSSLLEATYKNGKADINNATFAVKSNGKSGMDIRYYFNFKGYDEPEDRNDYSGLDEVVTDIDDFDPSQIPF